MELKERFLKYVGFDTQSDPESETYPSTAKQLILLNHLAEEMKELGLEDVEVDAKMCIRDRPWLMIISVAVTFFLMPVAVLFPLMTVTHFGGDTFQMSLVEIVWGAGTLLGGLILGVWKIKIRRVGLINSSYLALGSYILISGLLPSDAFVLFVCLTIIGGLAGSFYSGPFTSVLQTFIDHTALGLSVSYTHLDVYKRQTVLPYVTLSWIS